MKKILLVILLLAVCLPAWCQAAFQVIPPRNVIAGNKFMVKFKVVNGESGAPQAPSISGCKLLSPTPGRSTMQSFQMINGQSSSSTSVEYTFVYRAEKEGTYTIPAVSLAVDGKKLSTKATQFTVLPADKGTAQSQAARQGWGGYDAAPDHVFVDDLSTQTSDKKIGKDDIFVRIILNKQHVYEQEAVECTIKLYTKYQSIVSFMAAAPPTFDGFLIDEVDVQGQLNNVEQYNGQNYLTAVLKKCIIFPQKSGKLTISSGKYDLTVQQIERVSSGWYYTARPVEKKVVLPPYTSTVTITPLPEPRPAGFTNAVGKFQIESQLAPEELRPGEAAALTYIITGTGNIKYIEAPKPELPSEFEQYTPKTDSRARVSGSNVSGTTSIEYTFVPQSVGTFKIPAMPFVYFDPTARKYVTLNTSAYNVKVEKGAGASVSEQTDIKVKNTDILHIRKGVSDMSKDNIPAVRIWWYWSVYGLLIVLLAGAVVFASRRNAMLADVAGRRNAKAGKTAQKRLKLARRFMNEGKSEEFYAELLRAMWGYLSDKLTIPVSQLNRENIVANLSERGVAPELVENVIGVLDNCEMARYTPGASEASTIHQSYEQAEKAVTELDRARLLRK